MTDKIIPKKIFILFFLLFVSATFTYKANPTMATLWYLFTIILYLRSKDEAFWFVFYFALNVGFLGFFGRYEALISILPNLPGIEVAQFYIFATVLKVQINGHKAYVFYDKYLKILWYFILFLVLLGFVIETGSEINFYLRNFKVIFPFLIFYSLPRLINDEKVYQEIFNYLFIFVITAFLSQIFNLATGSTPAVSIGYAGRGGWSRYDPLAENTIYRGFYSDQIVLISVFGVIYLLAKNISQKYNFYLWLILFFAYSCMIISASRGWILSFGIVIILLLLFITRLNVKHTVFFSFIVTIFVVFVFSSHIIQEQLLKSVERFETIALIQEGDVTLGGTYKRIDVRGKTNLDLWEESPLLGLGFSKRFDDYNDRHTGNQSILAHSGIIGFCLLMGFLFFFNNKILQIRKKLPLTKEEKNSLLTFSIFFIGWFILHTVSRQEFGFAILPEGALIQVLFFSFGGLLYNKYVFSSAENNTSKE